MPGEASAVRRGGAPDENATTVAQKMHRSLLLFARRVSSDGGAGLGERLRMNSYRSAATSEQLWTSGPGSAAIGCRAGGVASPGPVGQRGPGGFSSARLPSGGGWGRASSSARPGRVFRHRRAPGRAPSGDEVEVEEVRASASAADRWRRRGGRRVTWWHGGAEWCSVAMERRVPASRGAADRVVACRGTRGSLVLSRRGTAWWDVAPGGRGGGAA
ncbi:unnamed protein product [Lampetra planeri]